MSDDYSVVDTTGCYDNGFARACVRQKPTVSYLQRCRRECVTFPNRNRAYVKRARGYCMTLMHTLFCATFSSVGNLCAAETASIPTGESCALKFTTTVALQ